jgi:DnaJ-class molecular chaperone
MNYPNDIRTKTCPDCKGRAHVVVDGVHYECTGCAGTGKVKAEESSPTNESTRIRLND